MARLPLAGVRSVFLSLGVCAYVSAGGFQPSWPTERADLTPQTLGISFPVTAIEFNAAIFYGRAYFGLTDLTGPLGLPDGILDTVDLFNSSNAPNVSSIRVGANASANQLVLSSPLAGPIQPSTWDGGVHSFSAGVISTGPAASVTSPLISLVMDERSQFQVGGTAYGAGGLRQNFSASVFFGAPDSEIIFSPASDVIVDLGLGGPHETPLVEVSTLWNGMVSTDYPVTVGNLPAVIADNVRLSGSAISPRQIQLVDLTDQDVGVHVIPFTTDLGFGPFTRSLRFVVVPEPTIAIFFAAATMRCAGRSRRK